MHDEHRDALSSLSLGASSALARLHLQRSLKAEATRDPLTGVANRRLFVQRLTDAHRGAMAATQSVCVLSVDIDDFKAINDGRGHDAGDAVLVAFAQRLQTLVRGDDLVARLGGDEFAAVVVGPPDDEVGHELANRIRAALRRPVELAGGAPVAASASVGWARWEPGMDVGDLMRASDAAMYRDKRGRTARTPTEDSTARARRPIVG